MDPSTGVCLDAVDCHECAVAAAARALIPVLLFSSWDRVPYWTKRANGSTEVTPLVNRIFSNLIINGYGGVWTLDHDDGSSYYNDTSNFLVYGGCKNYKGDHKNCGPNNVILFPGIFSRSSSGSSSPPRWGSCQTNDKCVAALRATPGARAAPAPTDLTCLVDAVAAPATTALATTILTVTRETTA